MTAAVVLKKECRDQPLEKVVVFNDRAELVRKVEFELQAGINEVHLENVTGNVIYDSVRVDGRGDGVIHDVQLTERAAVHEETDSPKVAEIRSRHEAKQKQLNELRDRQSVLKRRIDVLDKVVEGAGESVVRPPKTSGESFILSQDTLENLTNFYNFYEESSTSVRSQLRGVNAEVEKAERELSAIQDELNRAESDSYQQRFSKSIVVTLESEKGGVVELKVSYQVHGARWHPTYDLRVCTTGEKSLKITYYGNISQNTKEDWTNAVLVLSTAQPCLGGQIPELGVLDAVLYRPPPPQPQRPHPVMMRTLAKSSRLGSSRGSEAMALAAVESDSVMESSLGFGMAEVAAPAENALSAEFVIAKPAAIPSDDAEHKVTIGMVDLAPQLMYMCVPSKNTSTFLTSSAVNTSQFPFLPGDTAVYLNGSFVAKTHMKNVSPGERFSCSLGIDTALRVDYKPARKYHEQIGLINKSSSTVHEQVIVIKNSRADSVLITIKEQIPRSTDEKIKIKLVSPATVQNGEATNGADEAQLPKEGACMKASILEWTVAVPGGESKELHVKWALEHPSNEKVEFVERN